MRRRRSAAAAERVRAEAAGTRTRAAARRRAREAAAQDGSADQEQPRAAACAVGRGQDGEQAAGLLAAHAGAGQRGWRCCGRAAVSVRAARPCSLCPRLARLARARRRGRGADCPGRVRSRRSRTASFEIMPMAQSVEAVKKQHARMQPPLAAKVLPASARSRAPSPFARACVGRPCCAPSVLHVGTALHCAGCLGGDAPCRVSRRTCRVQQAGNRARSAQHSRERFCLPGSACSQNLNVLKNFQSKPIQKRQGIKVERELELPPFVPPPLPDRVHSGGAPGSGAEGKAGSTMPADDDDDDAFMASIDLDGYPAPAPVGPAFPRLPPFAQAMHQSPHASLERQHCSGCEGIEPRKSGARCRCARYLQECRAWESRNSRSPTGNGKGKEAPT